MIIYYSIEYINDSVNILKEREVLIMEKQIAYQKDDCVITVDIVGYHIYAPRKKGYKEVILYGWPFSNLNDAIDYAEEKGLI